MRKKANWTCWLVYLFLSYCMSSSFEFRFFSFQFFLFGNWLTIYLIIFIRSIVYQGVPEAMTPIYFIFLLFYFFLFNVYFSGFHFFIQFSLLVFWTERGKYHRAVFRPICTSITSGTHVKCGNLESCTTSDNLVVYLTSGSENDEI